MFHFCGMLAIATIIGDWKKMQKHYKNIKKSDPYDYILRLLKPHDSFVWILWVIFHW